MSKNMQTFAVSKNGKFIGYADAGQIANSGGVLKLYDESKAKLEMAEAAIGAAKASVVEKSAEIVVSEKSGGADPAAVKKGPARPKPPR